MKDSLSTKFGVGVYLPKETEPNNQEMKIKFK